jgi:hypothetical protein
MTTGIGERKLATTVSLREGACRWAGSHGQKVQKHLALSKGDECEIGGKCRGEGEPMHVKTW